MADLFDKLSKFTEAREAQALGIYPFFRALSHSEGVTAQFEGREVVMLGSNNYLGLTTDERVKQAMVDATLHYGTSVTGSRFLNGTLDLHLDLEQRLANFVGKEAALIFSTGYQTNLGTVSALLGKNDYAIMDKDAHASTVDGVFMSRGQMKRFRHNDMNNLERVLKQIPADAGKLVIVDGVYSMGGDIAPLGDVVALCKQYGARLMVDDAHGLGMMGQGRGTSHQYGVTDDVDLIMGTFSKSFASVGGFIAGDKDVIHYIQHHARPLIFSASLPAPNIAAVGMALDIMETEPVHVERLWENANYMRRGFKQLGYNTGNSETPIIPVIIGEKYLTGIVWAALIQEGVYTNPVIPPATPPNGSLLRTSYTATQTREHLDCALRAFKVVGERLDLITPTDAVDVVTS
ncbi:MAG: pyridoxal phosphate-dependent aminotransferase family protein [Chloroflexota bacterium]